MPSPRKLVVYLVGAAVVLTLVAVFCPERSPGIILLLLSGGVLVDGLATGELSFRRGRTTKMYRRRSAPLAYWSIVVFWGLWVGVALLMAGIGQPHQRPIPTAPGTAADQGRRLP